MNKKNIIYRSLRRIWLNSNRIVSFVSYVPYYLHKPVLQKKQSHNPALVVSFTTYPDRVWCLPMVVGSILRQTLLPDEIVLYLSREQFDSLNDPILRSIEKQGVRLALVDGDIRSHKKYFYAMQDYTESLIITIDDDIIYDRNMIEDLYQSYLRHPQAVSARRVHNIQFDKDRAVLPYGKWIIDTKEFVDTEMMTLIPTGCGGVLYPPNCLYKSWNDIDGIIKTCLRADDLWLKVMELLNGTPVVLAKSNNYKLKHVWGTNMDGLATDNVGVNGNDVQLQNICSYIGVDLHSVLLDLKK